jgi:lipopolysaccharide transport system ATP-binding protein
VTVLLDVSGLGKAFRRYRRESDRIAGWFGLSVAPAEERWVLRDIGFTVSAGEALGIVGRNGAGKSTLLKMIAGTLRPSEGRVGISGRIAAILELGMGFNGDFSGRRNAYFSAGMMGYSPADIDGAIDEIAAFSELGDYFDQPIRVYSSGMQMRLAFAVATAFRPDVLIVDEALSVGDTYFQHKSMQRIRDFRSAGTSLILVSHDKIALQNLCDRAILLDGGAIARDGSPETVLDYYNALIARQEGETIETRELGEGRIQTISGSRAVSVAQLRLSATDGAATDTVNVGAELRLSVAATVNRPVERLVFGYSIKDRFGQTLYGTNTAFSGQVVERPAVGETVRFDVRFPALFGPGTYSVAVALVGGEDHLETNYEWRDYAAMFTVVNLDRQPFDGKLYVPGTIEVDRG